MGKLKKGLNKGTTVHFPFPTHSLCRFILTVIAVAPVQHPLIPGMPDTATLPHTPQCLILQQMCYTKPFLTHGLTRNSPLVQAQKQFQVYQSMNDVYTGCKLCELSNVNYITVFSCLGCLILID